MKNKMFEDHKRMMKTMLIIFFIAAYLLLYLSAVANDMHKDVFQALMSPKKSSLVSALNPLFMFSHLTVSDFFTSMIIALLVSMISFASSLKEKNRQHDMEGIEQGSAYWLVNIADSKGKKTESAEAKQYREKMMDKDLSKNIMFNTTYGLSMDGRKTRKNLHMLVVGGSGAGKTRFFIKPNILQMNSSYIITDPSGELYRDMGQMLLDNHYDVRVFNTFDPNMSMQYNPLNYIRKDEDVISLTTTLIKNTGESGGDNKFFDDATKLLLCAIIMFLCNYCPKSEQDFAHVMQLVVATDVPEGQKNATSDMEKIFEQVKKIDPNGMALKMWNSFKSASGKTLKSILISTTTRLTAFNLPKIENLTCADTLSLDTIGDEKTALFIITPPTDNGFNFLVAMMYSQLFSTLYYHDQFECKYLLDNGVYFRRPFKTKEEAEHVYDLLKRQKQNPDQQLLRYDYDEVQGKYEMVDVEAKKVLLRGLREVSVKELQESPTNFKIVQNTKEEAGSPIHVRMLMDEFANINEIPGFSEVLATVRKYNISVVIVLQSLSQLKKLYEKDYESIIDNCDTFVFLGSKGQETTKYVSDMLGFTTIRQKNMSQSSGKGGTSSSYNQTKRELMQATELAQMPTDEQVVIVRAVAPFRIKKYELEKHPNYMKSADGDPSKRLNINKEFNIQEKMDKIRAKRGEVKENINQEEINKQAEQSVNAWMNNGSGQNSGSNSGNSQTDSFEFF